MSVSLHLPKQLLIDCFVAIISFANDVIDTAGNPPGSTGLQPRDETFTKATGQSIVLTTGIVYTCRVAIDVWV